MLISSISFSKFISSQYYSIKVSYFILNIDSLKRAGNAVSNLNNLQSELAGQTNQFVKELKKKTDELKEEATRQKEELNMTILNLEDKLRGQTAIVDKAKGDVNSKEDFIRELMKIMDNQEKDIKDLNKKLRISGEKRKELEERIKWKEQEHSRILTEKKDETNKIKDQLKENLQEFEKLKQSKLILFMYFLKSNFCLNYF